MSKHWTVVAGLAVSLSVVWLVFILLGSPWTGLMWVVSLALAAAVWSSQRAAHSRRSIGQLIADLETQPVPAIATPMPAPLPASLPVRSNKGDTP